tara:strand:- start:820 stop:1083 length:264 start_codon:yes stop_codon:yes gene_type:complete
MDKEILIYSSYNCGYCDRAKKLLDEKKISYREINIQDDPTEREVMLKKASGRRTVPQIFIKDVHIGGFQELHKIVIEGNLEKYLADG